MSIPMKKKISGTPPTPLKRPILGEQKPKWAVSSRRVCATVLKFFMCFLLTKIIGFQGRKKFRGSPMGVLAQN
jgi:hypothetical protein